MTRRPIVAGNWKMNKTVSEAVDLVRALSPLVGDVHGKVDVVVAPPFTALHAVHRVLEDSHIALAGQNCHWEPAGAFTGEVSAPMLKEAGCRFVIVGHSERRQYFGETDELVNRRARAAMEVGLMPIVCIGETLQEREAGETFRVVARQLRGGLARFSAHDLAHLVLAYEPVWAIGTGRNATADQAQEVHGFLREQLVELFGRPAADGVRIQYGGSVKPDNARELLGRPDVDGALVGGASLKAADFAAIVKAAA